MHVEFLFIISSFHKSPENVSYIRIYAHTHTHTMQNTHTAFRHIKIHMLYESPDICIFAETFQCRKEKVDKREKERDRRIKRAREKLRKEKYILLHLILLPLCKQTHLDMQDRGMQQYTQALKRIMQNICKQREKENKTRETVFRQISATYLSRTLEFRISNPDFEKWGKYRKFLIVSLRRRSKRWDTKNKGEKAEIMPR